MPNIPAAAFAYLTIQILKRFEELCPPKAERLYLEFKEDMLAGDLTRLINSKKRGFVSKYFGYYSNAQAKGGDFRMSNSNLRGCMIHFFQKNNEPKHYKYAYDKDTCVRQLWRNLTDFASSNQSVSLSVELLNLYKTFVNNSEIWKIFERKCNEQHDISPLPDHQNWHAFYCFFCGDDTQQEVKSFHLLIDVQPKLSVMDCKILHSPQNSTFHGTITIAASRHYATVDMHSGKHHRPLRIILELPDTEAELPYQGEITGLYVLINKQGERLHKGEMIITCNGENSQKEAVDLIGLSSSSYHQYPFPLVPSHIVTKIKQSQQQANAQEFKDKLPLLMHMEINRSELSASLPDAFMGQNFYFYTVEEPVVNQAGIIVKAVLHFSGNKGDVTLKNPQGYQMAHWDGFAYSSNGGMAIHLLLHSQKRSTLHPTLHIVFYIPAEETFIYTDNIPDATKYYTGAYLLFASKGKITSGTVVLEHIRNPLLSPTPSLITPKNEGFIQLNNHIEKFFQHKSNNALSIPKIFSDLDWENFFAKNDSKQFSKIKKIPGGKWVYLAAPASHIDEKTKTELKKLLTIFKYTIEQKFKVRVFAPFLGEKTLEAKAGMIEVSQEIVRYIKKSDRMIMFYPTPNASTCLIELGMALSDHHKIHVFYNDSSKMPFLLRDLAHSNRITDTPYSEQHIKNWLKYSAEMFFS